MDGQAKVTNFNPMIPGQVDIGGLEVSMNKLLFVNVGNASTNLAKQLDAVSIVPHVVAT